MSICHLSGAEIDNLGWLDFNTVMAHCDAVVEVRNKAGGW